MIKLLTPLAASVALLGTFASSSAAFADDTEAPRKPKVVELVITDAGGEDPAPVNPLGPTPRNFRADLELIRRIAADEEVAAVRLKIKSTPDFARSLDVLEELRAVKAAGKPIVCYTEMLDQRKLLFASVADHLAVPPSAMIVLEGLAAEVMYLHDMLEKVDVEFEVLHVGDYKAAYEELARSEMSDFQREQLGALLGEFYGQMLDTISENRGIERASVEAIFAELMVAPEHAKAAGLIDAVSYGDAFDAYLEQMLGGEFELVDDYGDQKVDLDELFANPFAMMANMQKMMEGKKAKRPDEPYVQVVYASGTIVSGKSVADFQGNVSSMGSDTIVKALDSAYEDDHCKAVVLRVNSPGGSALASDMIWRAIERVQTKKPVVSSMGYVAASGGYWISMGCDAILVQPSTITGSIGVVSMLPDVSAAVRDLGVNVEVVSAGPHGDSLSLLRNGPTDKLRGILMHWMKDTYDEFIAKVAEGRRLDPARVRELAGGRVWTGRQAVEVGLADEIGGLDDAIALACVLGGGLDPIETPIVETPAPPDFFEALEEAFGGMAQITSRPAAWFGPLQAARAAGFGSLADAVEAALADPAPFSENRVQAVLPWHVRIR